MKKVGNSSIWYEKYAPTCVDDIILPNDLHKTLLKFVTEKDIPNLGLFSSEPGCLLPGTNITIQCEQNYITLNELKSKYSLDKFEIIKVKNMFSVKNINDLIDENLVTKELLIIIKSKGLLAKSLGSNYKLDKKFNDKHLKLTHWLTKLSPEEAVKKLLVLRKYKQFFDIDLDNKYFKNWNKENLLETILKIKFKMIYTEFNSITDIFPSLDKNTTLNFWLYRGFSSEEAKCEISKIQSKNYLKLYDKYTTEELKKIRSKGQRKEYWLEKGYSEEESIKKLKERQSTFSLEKCIEKYGEELGLIKFIERQEKWQRTLNSKSQEEKNEISKLKSKNSKYINDKTSILYYIRFYNDELNFWKIGITSSNFIEGKRFEKNNLFKLKYNLNYEIIMEKSYDTMREAYEKEQEILQIFNKNRVIINYNKFKTTEAFNIDIIKGINERL